MDSDSSDSEYCNYPIYLCVKAVCLHGFIRRRCVFLRM